MKNNVLYRYKEPINYKWALLLMLAIKLIAENYAANCYSYYVIKSIVMSFNIMTEQYFLKGFNTKEKTKLTKHLNK